MSIGLHPPWKNSEISALEKKICLWANAAAKSADQQRRPSDRSTNKRNTMAGPSGTKGFNTTVAFAALERRKGGGDWRDLVLGPTLQCLEAASLGMPFEVWKTRMGRFRHESTLTSFANVYKEGGITAFWKGTGPKMVESATKGAILLYAKEGILTYSLKSGMDPTLAGVVAGAGGGICQVSVMGPCTFLVTGAVTGTTNESTMQRVSRVYRTNGLAGFYPGGTAIAFRQATNWASRQGFTEAVRHRFKIMFHGDENAKLTTRENILAGVCGGSLSCWNHPFEVARIEAQARADQGQSKLNMIRVMQMVVRENGVKGLFQGIVPRWGLGVWQTLFMVTGPKLVKDALGMNE